MIIKLTFFTSNISEFASLVRDFYEIYNKIPKIAKLKNCFSYESKNNEKIIDYINNLHKIKPQQYIFNHKRFLKFLVENVQFKKKFVSLDNLFCPAPCYSAVKFK